jgi:hypothetical protein
MYAIFLVVLNHALKRFFGALTRFFGALTRFFDVK